MDTLPISNPPPPEYKPTGQAGWFDAELTLDKLSRLGNPLEKLLRAVGFEMFRPVPEEKLLNRNRKSNAGCKPYDAVLMFKVMLLKRFYNLSDEQAGYQINGRASFRAFLGLSSGGRVPDARTLWLFQENVKGHHPEKALFELFNRHLDGPGLFVNEGRIVDASFVEVPRQRNTREENEKIKAGEGAGLWQDNPRKRRQKDVGARWAKKNGQTFYGYKGHAKVDAKSKPVRCRVEHVFGFISNSMGGFHSRVIGLRRTRCVVGLVNLVYNLFRHEQIIRLKLLPLPGGAMP